MSRRYEKDDTEGMVCSECKKEAETKAMDFGIGALEYWGSRETHTDMRTVSLCCEAEMEWPIETEEDAS